MFKGHRAGLLVAGRVVPVFCGLEHSVLPTQGGARSPG